ncbi:MAG: metallophosphoesterase [Deltaproteobacteria bacterium]|nr:metallophosphoesterase [Deltaproteobacteria bacterium]
MGTVFYLFISVLLVDLGRWLLRLGRTVVAFSTEAASGSGAAASSATAATSGAAASGAVASGAAASGAAASGAMASDAETASLLDPDRRLLLARGTAGAAAIVAGSFAAVALKQGLSELEVREVPIRLPRLPRALSGLTIVQLTDVHVGPTIGQRFVRSVVEKTNQLRPDVVVITGDLVDGSVRQLFEHVGPLANFKTRYGVFFATGNHEYYSGVVAWAEALARLGIRVLANERTSIGDPRTSFDLIGVNDRSARDIQGPWRHDLEAAVRGRDPDRASILLAHQPRGIEDAARLGVDLQLSGHTHGGQFWPFSHLVALTQPYMRGLHAHNASTQIYVSCGTGYWGPPMRLFAPAEITKIVLTC